MLENAQWLRKFLKNLATFFGIGFFPKSPGTAGTVATIPLVLLLSWAGPLVYMSFVILLFPVAVFAAQAYQEDLGGHDRQEIVIDEVLGFLITMTWLPMTWKSMLAGFLLFRVLDIFKPFPIGYLDKKVPGGLGVIIDDVVAGIIASMILQYIYQNTSWLGQQVMVFTS
ncbi:phosphatidylglycerophosphatase A [Bdellovibrio sp. HCB337]|uniref:phosphatidylglycerophosphatase A family protein n=1 Tax=Bdellovibrio sp. HCB337 TaxID=3394358 RepID=UPI0039A41783